MSFDSRFIVLIKSRRLHNAAVATVTAVNSHDTVARSDDTVNNFSSRGPTRGGTTHLSGVRVADNLLKPGLVAPGNKIVSTTATMATQAGAFRPTATLASWFVSGRSLVLGTELILSEGLVLSERFVLGEP